MTSRVEIGIWPQRNTNFCHQGVKKGICILMVLLFVMWKLAFQLNEILIFAISIKEHIRCFMLSLCMIRGRLRESVFTSMPQGRSTSLELTCFHIWRYVSTCRSTPHLKHMGLNGIDTGLYLLLETFRSPLFKVTPCGIQFLGPSCRLFPRDFWMCIFWWRHSWVIHLAASELFIVIVFLATSSKTRSSVLVT